MIRIALRAIAVLIAVAALWDPARAVRQPRRLAVGVATDRTARAAALRDELAATLGRDIRIDSSGRPDAIVLVGDAAPPDEWLAGSAPISSVALIATDVPNVRIAGTYVTDRVLAGQEALITAIVGSRGVTGRATTIALEQDGIELARVEHRWSASPETFRAELRFTAPAAGLRALRVVARPFDDEGSGEDNVADIGVRARAGRLRVLVYEPRPSWNASFVRRTLEDDPIFAVAARVRPSRGIDVLAGGPPVRIDPATLAPFDAVVIGAAEELSAAEVEALTGFVGERGGALVLLPDRRPVGPYLRLLPSSRFEEVLVERPLALRTAGGGRLQASELAIPTTVEAGGEVLAASDNTAGSRPVIVSWPYGAGRIVYSGALDAWRFRAGEQRGFARFWPGTIGSLAADAPPRVHVQVEPALAAPGDRVTVRVRLRPTEIVRHGQTVRWPACEAALVSSDGQTRMLRLWPRPEGGIYESTIAAPDAGDYDVKASIDGAASDAPLMVRAGVQPPPAIGDEVIAWLVSSSGGVEVTAGNLEPLRRHLSGLPRETAERQHHPMRSPWWLAPFALALCAEWALRRRAGLR